MASNTSDSSRFVNQEAAAIARQHITFGFGENWKVYIADLNEATVAHAVNSFTAFTRLKNLSEHTFLDLGCGSGLNSLVAFQLGAKKVVSVDIDPNSIECVTRLREQFANRASTWSIVRGSVLDRSFIDSLGSFSYVYSYGVLHHTGAMWQSFDHVVPRVAPGGYLHIGIYNHHRNSARWLKVKMLCNRFPRTALPAFKASYILLAYLQCLARFQSPAAYDREYRAHRGMNMWRDIDDWFGGLPYEYATPAEIVHFFADKGFVLLRLRDASTGCNEFLFRSDSASAPMGERLLLLSWGVPPLPSGSAIIVGNLAQQFSVTEMIVAGERPFRQPAVSWRGEWPRLVYIASDLPPPGAGSRWWRRLQIPLMLARTLLLVRKFQCTALLAVFPNEEFLLVGYLAARWSGVPLSVYFHNTYVENRQGLGLHFGRWLQGRVFASARRFLS
jgi:2-polyprenyl-6-hydroxyphenyl methylase/3-demethylubiquinone-9 3-methyltransferase